MRKRSIKFWKLSGSIRMVKERMCKMTVYSGDDFYYTFFSASDFHSKNQDGSSVGLYIDGNRSESELVKSMEHAK